MLSMCLIFRWFVCPGCVAVNSFIWCHPCPTYTLTTTTTTTPETMHALKPPSAEGGWFSLYLRVTVPPSSPQRALWDAAASENARWGGLHVTLSAFHHFTKEKLALLKALPYKAAALKGAAPPSHFTLYTKGKQVFVGLDSKQDPFLAKLLSFLSDQKFPQVRNPSSLHLTLGSASELAKLGLESPAVGSAPTLAGPLLQQLLAAS